MKKQIIVLISMFFAHTTTHAAQPAQSPQKQTTRTITANNNITKKMLGYKKFGTHYPSTFDVSFNGTLIAQGESAPITLKNNELTVTYDWAFGKHRQGTKEVIFTVEPTAKELNVTFSWLNDWRMQVEGATPVKANTLRK